MLKKPVVLTERLRRCLCCRAEMMDVSSLSYEQNPYCGNCLTDRMGRASAKFPFASWKQSGDYLEVVTLDPRKRQ